MILLVLFSFSFSDVLDEIGDFWSGLNEAHGPTGFEVLQFDMDAMVSGMGGNYWDEGIHASSFNPAEIMKISGSYEWNSEVIFTHRTLACGMNTEFIGYSRPMWGGAVGITMLGFFSGEMELRGYIPGELFSSYSAENLIAGFTYARRYGELSIGGTCRYLHERIFTDSYSTYSFDFGMSRLFPLSEAKALRMDIAFLHLGPKYTELKFRLPVTWRVGFKAHIGSFRGGISLSKPLNTKLQYSLGGEYKIGWFALRAGKKFENPLEKYSFGFGIAKDRFTLDYSYAPTDNGYEGAHLFTASIGL